MIDPLWPLATRLFHREFERQRVDYRIPFITWEALPNKRKQQFYNWALELSASRYLEVVLQ